MADRDLVLKKLAFIETCVGDLRTLARLDLIRHDLFAFATAVRDCLAQSS